MPRHRYTLTNGEPAYLHDDDGDLLYDAEGVARPNPRYRSTTILANGYWQHIWNACAFAVSPAVATRVYAELGDDIVCTNGSRHGSMRVTSLTGGANV